MTRAHPHNTQPQPVRVEAEAKPAGPACPAAAAAAALLARCDRLLGQIDDTLYAAPSRLLPGGTIGKHVRHIVDHFAAALVALHDPGATIDYDHRQRDTADETSRSAARTRITTVRTALAGITAATGTRPVRTLVMLSDDGACATLGSTLARELAFAAHHATHHFAMIGAICREHGLTPPEGFGKAPSTLHHERHA